MSKISVQLCLLVGLCLALPQSTPAQAPDADGPTPVEHVTDRSPRDPNELGTMQYAPSEQEAPHYDKLDAEERTTGGFTRDYDISEKDGRYVGWWGIVREIAEDEATSRTSLTIEHKYFDGLTDAHVLALSFNGSGDFHAALGGIGHGIGPLTLVKVYGTAAGGGDAGPPHVEAVFVRNWHWGAFTFLSDYGEQRGSEAWRKLNRVELENIYDPEPDDNYYRERLGERPEDEARRAAFRQRVLQAAAAIRPDAAPMAESLIDALASLDYEALDEALRAALKGRADDLVVAVLTAALEHHEPDVRMLAVGTLADFGPDAAVALPALTALLDDEDVYLRRKVAEALGRIGPEAASAVPALIAVVQDDDSHVRANACESLARIGMPADDIVRALVGASTDSDWFVRFVVVGALGDMGEPAAAALEPLIARLAGDADDNVRWRAALSVGMVAPDGELAVPALLDALRDGTANVRRFAAMGLGEIGPAAGPGAPALREALADADVGVRIAAAEALWRVEGEPKASLPVLMQALEQQHAMARMWAADALAHMGPQAQEAMPALTEALEFDHVYVRDSAAEALGNIGPAASAAAPALIELLEDSEGIVRVAAAEALWKIERHPMSIARIVAELLAADSMTVLNATAAIQAIGPPAREAAPALNELLVAPDFEVRHAAALALQAVNSETPPAVQE